MPDMPLFSVFQCFARKGNFVLESHDGTSFDSRAKYLLVKTDYVSDDFLVVVCHYIPGLTVRFYSEGQPIAEAVEPGKYRDLRRMEIIKAADMYFAATMALPHEERDAREPMQNALDLAKYW